jgi:DNA-binding NarL/FixJ family response regulator
MGDIKVLIADDHPIVRKGIQDLLNSSVGITVVGEASSGKEALTLIAALKPEVVLLDVEMPDINGVEVIGKLAESSMPVKVLALSSYDDREYISHMLALGACGYLIKDEVPGTIVEAVRGVARGEKGWVSRKVAAKLSQMLDNERENKDLTPRELDVLSLVSQGKTNAEIGFLLKISEKTVEKHLDLIFRKMGVTSRVEAAVTAVREHIV